MAEIRFERYPSTFKIHNPFNDFAEEEHRVEVRKDPLLGDTSVYNPYLKDKAKAFFGANDPELIGKLVDETAKSCIFCGENVRQRTARYTDDLVPGGRIAEGEAVLFANLFAIATHHPVIALSKAHFLKLSEFSPRLLADGFSAARTFLKDIYRRDGTVTVATVNANYLLPAGASLVHPHLQMLATAVPYSYHGRLLEAAGDYLRRNGTCYFTDLVAEEQRQGERYIGSRGRWHWLAAFSPLGSNEITGIHEEASDLGRLADQDLLDLSHGISRTLAFFEELGHLSFNFTLYSAKGAEGVGARCVVKIVCRQNLYANYRNDDYFLQRLLHSELILNLPEELAAKARGCFADRGSGAEPRS